MPFKENNNRDYSALNPSKNNNGGKESREQSTLKPSNKLQNLSGNGDVDDKNSLLNYRKEQKEKVVPHYSANAANEPKIAEDVVLKAKTPEVEKERTESGSFNKVEDISNLLSRKVSSPNIEEDYSEKLSKQKKRRQTEKDFKILKNESWVARNGHFLTYAGLYCFTILVYFRPYELFSALGFLSATAFYFALATLIVYLPTQFSTDGNLTTLSTEVKCILVITFLAIMTIPIAKSPAIAWEEFSGTFIKAVVMFVVMVNVLRTRERLMGMIWLSVLAGVVLSYMALRMYLRGEMSVEGYRVSVNVGGMFGNPNELALHLVLMLPIAFALGLAAKNKLVKLLLFLTVALFVGAIVVTYSRGGFLGMLAVSIFLIWKLGKQQKVKIYAVASVVFVLFVLLVPGEYGSRIFSIFDSTLDAVGSSNQRSDLLKRSIYVSVRNPWGIGIGNFKLVGFQNLGTHNAFTQVSSELGIISVVAYIIFLISPFRKLGAIERRIEDNAEMRWFYYLSIGLQASILAYLVSGFFAAVAYNWFAFYLIAYAVAFRRIYLIEQGLSEEDVQAESITENLFGWQIKST